VIDTQVGELGYLRTPLVHGERSVLRVAQNKPATNSWILRFTGRRHKNITAVALANKNARVAWAPTLELPLLRLMAQPPAPSRQGGLS